MNPVTSEIRLTLNCNDLSDEQVQAIGEYYARTLTAMASAPTERYEAQSLLSEQERYQLLVEWNATVADFPEEQTIAQLFEAQVQRTPDAVAVVFEEEQLTYLELNRRANQLAHHLRMLGVGPEVLVALLFERGSDLLITILAVFKAGGVYLPLDPLHPATRLRQVLEHSGSRLVLTATEFSPTLSQVLMDILPSARPRILYIEQLRQQAQAEENLPACNTSRHLSYVIYTSGSTGVPKGAMIEHRGMLNHLYAKISALHLTDTDTVAQTASQCFDISVWQFLAALLVGGRVQIFTDAVAHDPIRLLVEVDHSKVSILETVPSLLRAMLEAVKLADPVRPDLAALRWLIPTGEALPPELCDEWLRLYPHIPLLNAYGPTECSDDVTHYPIFHPLTATVNHTPIGRPVINTQLYVLDRMLAPVPIGVCGELYVGGIGVGRGYLGDALRTAEAFIPDPFGAEPGARLYRTGDLARYLPDGNIEFLGRIDHQVKIRGYRIELGEIETVLGQHSAVKEVVVLAREDGLGDKRLVAYVVPAQRQVPTTNELRRYLQGQLPEYMLPTAFVMLDALPLTPNGKVDRSALPVDDQPGSELEGFVAPRTPEEKLLAEIWSQVLGVERVGIHDDFFELGGHSLLATQLISRLRNAFQVDLPLRRLFEAPTVAGLIQSINAACQVGSSVRGAAIDISDLNAEAALDSTINPETG